MVDKQVTELLKPPPHLQPSHLRLPCSPLTYVCLGTHSQYMRLCLYTCTHGVCNHIFICVHPCTYVELSIHMCGIYTHECIHAYSSVVNTHIYIYIHGRFTHVSAHAQLIHDAHSCMVHTCIHTCAWPMHLYAYSWHVCILMNMSQCSHTLLLHRVETVQVKHSFSK